MDLSNKGLIISKFKIKVMETIWIVEYSSGYISDGFTEAFNSEEMVFDDNGEDLCIDCVQKYYGE